MLNLFTNGKNPSFACVFSLVFAADYAALFITFAKCHFYMWVFVSHYLEMETT